MRPETHTVLLGMCLPMLLASPVPTPTPLAVINQDALYQGEYVVTLVNSHTTAITTAHNQNVGSPTAIHDDGSVIEAGSTAIIALPTGWAGRVAMAEINTTIHDRASLLEGAFVLQGDAGARITLDVSYVDGFTVPIVCECGGEVVLGCNLNLLEMCPDEYRIDAGTCMNPSRDGPADNFFKDCAALAYTFPKDDRATINGIQNCEASIRCCVGTACAPHPRQQLCPGADRTAQLCLLLPDYKNSSAL